MVYNLGHAVFEFIEAKWGKEGIRQYLFNLRKAVIGGGEEAYQESFQISADDFDQQFDKYLKDRFKPFRDKERPADYGRNLAPDPERTRVQGRLLRRAVTVRGAVRRRHGQRIRPRAGHRPGVGEGRQGRLKNLTSGFDQDLGFEYLVDAGRPLGHGAVDVVVARR